MELGQQIGGFNFFEIIILIVDVHIVYGGFIRDDGSIRNIVGTSHTSDENHTITLVNLDTDTNVLDLVSQPIRFRVHDLSGTRVADIDGLSFYETRRVYTLYLTIRHRGTFLSG